MRYAGPDGETPAQWELIAADELGFTHCPTMYFTNTGSGTVAMDRVDAYLASYTEDTTRVMLDLEGTDFKCYEFDGNSLTPVTEPIQTRIDLFNYIKAACPWVEFGYYATVPSSFRALESGLNNTITHGTADIPNIAAAEDLDHKLIDLAEAVDVLIPEFYFVENYSASIPLSTTIVSDWANRVFERASRLYPDATIMPIVWPNYADVALALGATINDQDFDWTSAILEEIRISPALMRALLSAMDDYGIEDLLMWQAGYQPWDANAEWLAEVQEWHATSTEPSAYCTTDDIEALFGTDNVTAWATLATGDGAASIAARKASAIAVASDELDEVLRCISAYEKGLPIATVPTSVADKVAIRAGVWLYSSRRTDDAANQGGHVEVLEKQYQQWLSEVRSGARKLYLGQCQ